MTIYCALYRRVSDERQKEGASLDEQDQALRAYAGAQGWPIVADYNEASSTWHGTRGQFEQMIEDARAGKFQRILVWALDRFARRSGEIHSVTEELEGLGVHVILVKEGIDLCDGSIAAKAIKSALALAADLENVARSDRSRMAWKHRKGLRLFHGRLPTGYRYTGKHQPAEIHEEGAAGVRRAFRLYATGQYSMIALCSKLNDEGHRTNQGKRYCYQSLRGILGNTAYAGKFEIDGELVDSNEPAVIEWKLFEQVQRVMEAHARAPRSVSRKLDAYLLRGLVYCQACGRKMYAQRTQDGIARYKDSSYFKRQVCPASELIERGEGVMVKEADLAPQIEWLVKAFRLLPAWRERVLDILASRDERRALEAQRKALEVKLERLKTLYVEGDLDLGEYRDRRDGLREELEALVVPQEREVLDAGQFLETMAAIWDEATLEERHDLLTAIFRKVWVDRVSARVVAVEVVAEFVPVFRQMGLVWEGGRFLVEAEREVVFGRLSSHTHPNTKETAGDN